MTDQNRLSEPVAPVPAGNAGLMDPLEEGKQMRSQKSSDGDIELRLYVAGDASHSVQALANLKTILDTRVSSDNDHPQMDHPQVEQPEKVHLEVVDVLEEPLRALEDDVFVTPTLLMLAPTTARITGSLNEREKVAQLLGLE
jgi:circadian clock protein KaiB